MRAIRDLVVVLGDQLSHESAVFDTFDPKQDLVWMAEVASEATYVLSHKVRIAFFLTAMRHFAQELEAKRYKVEYRRLDAHDNRGDLGSELQAAIRKFKPKRIVMLEAGEYRIESLMREASSDSGIELDVRTDRSFFCSRGEFAVWAKQHKQLRLEFFYREMRKRTGVLMERRQPVGRWNFDTENRKSFGKTGPGLLLPKPVPFPPDEITREVLTLVEERFPKHPGSLARFELPVTAKDARVALDDFIAHRLPEFGAYQDAMWTDTPFLYHSRLSATMNLKLLDPRVVVEAVEGEYRAGRVPLASAEGYIRQILGWREYVRGVYWHFMPEYINRNALHAHEKLPDFYWDGNTDMNCLKQAVGETLEFGYAHHIQRLMVTGLYALLFAVEPVEVHKWYLAIYWDAIEWVEMPNVTGLSQFADGGIAGSKPYIASGKYINRMSNYCESCRYKPDESTGPTACPFTTLYWEFLMRHEEVLVQNLRTRMQVRNLQRLSPARKRQILEQAAQIRESTPKGSY